MQFREFAGRVYPVYLKFRVYFMRDYLPLSARPIDD